MQARFTRLPVIEVGNPCAADWGAMSGDSRMRFCGQCDRHVHDLSAMTSTEASELLGRSSGRVCVRFAAAEDGRPITLDYRTPPRSMRTWRFWTICATIAAAVTAAANAYLTGKPQPPVPPNLRMVMGDVCIPPPATSPSGSAPAGQQQ